MRIAKLQLIRYGRFADCELDFPAGDLDFQLILGPNEAGKSTTLAAVSDLLFGFPGRTRFAFKFDQTRLRIGAILECDGDQLEIRRRKGNANTLLDASEANLDPARLTPLLSGQSRESFERMFGLDHTRLREGGKAILAAKDDVGAAIFAAGSGLTHAAEICEALDREAKDIWARGAGDGKRYIAASTAYQDARQRLKIAEVRPSAWVKAKRDFEAATGELEALRSERAGLTQQRQAVQRRQLARPPAVRRATALSRLSELGGAPELSAVAAARCAAALEAARSAKTEIERAMADVERLAPALEGARPQPEVVAVAAEAESLRELKGVVDQGAAKLAARRAERDTLWSRVRASVAEIGWEQANPEALKARLPGRSALAEVRDLIERRATVDERQRAAAEALREDQATHQRLQQQLEELPTASDVRPLQILARDLRTAGHSQARQQAETTSRELRTHLEKQLRALAPWTGDVVAVRALAVPASADIDHALDHLDAARECLRSEMDTMRGASDRLARARLERDQAVRSHEVPAPEDLETARRLRAEAWSPLRAHLAGEPLPTDPIAAADCFEDTIRQADRVADERFAAAALAGNLAARERDIESCQLELDHASAGVKTAEAEVQAAELAYAALLEGLGLSISPHALGPWLEAYTAAIEAAEGLDLAQEDLRAAQAAEGAARATLAAALDGAEDYASASLQTLLDEADRRVESAADVRTQAEGVRGHLSAAAETLKRSRAQAHAAQDAVAAWSEDWAPALTRAGLSMDATPVSARAQLEIIEALRGELDALIDLDAQLASIGKSSDAFAQRVAAAALNARLPADASAMEGYAMLQSAVTDATARAERTRALEASLEEARQRLGDARGALATAEADLTPLRRAAPDGDADALRDFLDQAAEAARLRDLAAELGEEILGVGEGRALEELIAEATGATADELGAEAAALDDRLAQINLDIEAKAETRLAAKQSFEALDDGPDAAIAAFEMEQARSEMAFQAELFIRKRAEGRLLRAAIDRYRREKQGPLLARASVLFETLTLGGFSSLTVDFDDNAPKLAGLRTDDEAVVGVDGMSDGTIDQLYLALRIAAIEDAVAGGVRLPFVADDLFINYDDARAAAGFKVLAELSRKTQVLFFTHHDHLAGVAGRALHPLKASVCGLGHAQPASKLAEVPAA